MKETINFLITFSLFAIAIRFYIVKPKATVAQGNETNSEELLAPENETIRPTNSNEFDRRGSNNEDLKINEELETEATTLEQNSPEKLEIEDVRLPDVDENNLPAEPPSNEAEVNIPL